MQNRKSLYRLNIHKTKLIILGAAVAAAMPTVAKSAGVDQFQFYFDANTSQGGTNGIGGFTYDATNNVFWTAGFTGTSQAIRKITKPGASWTGTPWVGQTAWLNQYAASTSLVGSGTVPAAPWGVSSEAVGNIRLNPATITINSITYAPGTLGVLVDQVRITDGTTIQPAHSKFVYTYDLRLIGSANTGRDRNSNGIVDWNDVFDTVTTMADLQAVQSTINGVPVTANSATIARSFAFSSDGQSIYFNDSAASFGGVWKSNLTTGALVKVVNALTSNRINTEVDVVPSSLRNFGGGTGDQVMFQGGADTGNDRGLSYIVDNNTNSQSAITLLTAKQMASYLDNGAQPDVAGITHDSSGNIFLTSGSTPNGVFVYDTNGRLAKVFSNAEKRVFDAANGMTGTTYNSLVQDMDVRSATVNLTGGGTTSLTQVLFSDATSGARFPVGVNFWKIGDFNRDNLVNAADITLFKANLGLRGATAASITGTTAPTATVADKFKYDLNGDTIVTGTGATAVAAVTIDWKDVKILQQFTGLSDGDVNMDFAVDSTDLNTIGSNYNGTGKLFTQGNLTSVRYTATDKDTVNFADLITLAANWTAAKPALAAVGSISAADIDRAFAITSGGTINQLTNFAGGALTWSTAGNWSSGVPNGAGAVASLLTKPFNDVNLDIDGSYTLGQLNFDSYFTYTLSGAGTLHFDGNGTTAEINTIAQSPVISAGVAIDQNTNVNQTYSTDTLTLSGPLSIAAGKTLTKNGGGALTISGTQTHGAGTALTIAGGTVNLNSDGGTNIGISVAASTILNTNGTQNLTNIASAGQTNVQSGSAAVAAITGTGAVSVTGTGTALNVTTLTQSAMTVGAGASATVNTLNVSGSVTNNGTFTSSSGGSVPTINGTGTTNVSSGTLIASSVTQSVIAVASGATLNTNTLTVSTTSNDGNINVNAGPSQAGAVDGVGNLTVSGVTTLGAQHVRQAALSIGTGSLVNIAANGSASGVSKVDTLSIGASGLVNLHDNDLVVSYGANPTPYTAIVNLVKSGLVLLGGAGTTGITSTEVEAQTIPGTILAVVDDGHPDIAGGITTLSGYTIPNPATSVLVKYTWFGDANLDGIVTGSDYALTDTGFTSGGLLTGWVFGDYDYSGTIDGGDYALQDTGFIAQTGALPEPTTLGLLGLGVLGLNRRRRFVK